MKYSGMPQGMWLLFRNSFRRKLTTELSYDKSTAQTICKKAKAKYKEIIGRLPKFEKKDRFRMNIVSCAMLSAFILSMPKKHTTEEMTAYYRESMMIGAMRWFCKKSDKKRFTEQDIRSMKETAAFKAADRNPYSWNMDFYPYEDGSGYEARFTKCGICTLMKELGLYDYAPAMCRLDYTMSEVGGETEFVREYTLASGGPYCDCGYLKRNR